jgi:Dolichyl-phosphate-mannose-protein mannosyltransferase
MVTARTQDPIAARSWTWPLILVGTTLMALVLRWYYVTVTVVPEPLSGDAGQYYVYAWNLVHHGIFSSSAAGSQQVVPDNYRDPAYPLFLALWMKVLGAGHASYAAMLLCQALLGAITIGISMQICRQWLSIRWAAAAGLLMAVWPHSIATNGFLLTETLSGFLSSLGMLLWIQACQSNRPGKALASGLALGLAGLTNAVLQPFGIFLAALIAWRAPTLRKTCLILALTSAALPLAWAARNAHLPTTDIHASSRARAIQNLVQGSWPTYHSAWRASKLGNEAAKIDATITLNSINWEDEQLLSSPLKGIKTIMQRMQQHPAAYLTWYLFKKPYQLWGWEIEIGQGDIYPYMVVNSPFQTHSAWIALTAICHTINPWLLWLSLACLPMTWWQRRLHSYSSLPLPIISVITLLAFVTVVYCALQAEPRYATPFRSLEIALALTTLADLSARWSAYKGALARRQALRAAQ